MFTALASSAQSPPPALAGFEHIHRRWNAALEAFTARILPGEFYVTKLNEAVTTTLGSCVSACIRDPRARIGGMNHFMLPADASEHGAKDSLLSAAARYGNYAMEHLINHIVRNGGKRENLEVKVFGGGRIMSNASHVGKRNIAFVREYLATEGLKVTAEDLGDVYPRMVVYYPVSGQVRIKRLRSLHNNTVAAQESIYGDRIRQQPVAGEVELF
jgi:chemotaxis protein CheD